MVRKIVLALTASAALGAAALIPTSASAFGGHGGWHGGWYGIGLYPAPVYTGCVVRRWVPTPAGPRLRWVNVCY